MAFDLDDDELKATREMHKLSDKNVADDISNYNKEYKQAINKVAQFFPLSSEEVEAILNGEVSYKIINEINLSQSATELKDSVYAFRFAVMQQQLDEKEKKIKELEEETLLMSPYYVKQNYIPKRKVEDELEALRKMLKAMMSGKLQEYTAEEIIIKINTLEELLEK